VAGAQLTTQRNPRDLGDGALAYQNLLNAHKSVALKELASTAPADSGPQSTEF